VPSYNPNAKIKVSNRSYNAVKAAVENVYKSPAYKTAIALMGGVQFVATTIYTVINSAANFLSPLGPLLHAIESTYNLMGVINAKRTEVVKEILANLAG
jgi:hypothetical protein